MTHATCRSCQESGRCSAQLTTHREQRIAAVARAGFKPTPAKRRLAGGTPAVHYALVNGAPALLFVPGDQVVGAVTFDITDGKIATVRGIAAPTRLARLAEAWRQHEPDTPLITQW
ncbi:hypothetical protein QFZ82_006540 [Streptomyces sp. V4I23]|nr:hypothetical protein [Streptomyces sp. V4I23]